LGAKAIKYQGFRLGKSFYPLLHTSVRKFSFILKAFSPKMDPLKGGISVSYPLSSYLTLEPNPGKIWA